MEKTYRKLLFKALWDLNNEGMDITAYLVVLNPPYLLNYDFLAIIKKDQEEALKQLESFHNEIMAKSKKVTIK